MDYGLIVTLFGFATGTGLWLRKQRFSSRRGLRQQIVNATHLPIGELAAGSVAIVGRVRSPSRTLRAPVSGEEVVGYRLRVVQKRYNRYGTRHWKLVLDVAELADRFVIADRTGEVAIQPSRGFACFLKPGFASRATSPAQVPDTVHACLEANGERLQDDYFGLYEVEWYEATLRESQRVHVYGRADRLPDPRGRPTTYRQAPMRAVIHRSGALNVVVADRSRKALLAAMAQAKHIRGLP